ncbi:MAG: hypothetical protein ABW090_06785 [Sedimenticola sp.]
MQAVDQCEVNNPVFPTEWNCGFGTIAGQRLQSRTLPTGQNQSQGIFMHRDTPVFGCHFLKLNMHQQKAGLKPDAPVNPLFYQKK